ncbi:hypothetical protein Vafri_6004 [Volvox africanus]|nr:hypothetical protein Vafri_6004 [Volvox africanus]
MAASDFFQAPYFGRLKQSEGGALCQPHGDGPTGASVVPELPDQGSGRLLFPSAQTNEPSSAVSLRPTQYGEPDSNESTAPASSADAIDGSCPPVCRAPQNTAASSQVNLTPSYRKYELLPCETFLAGCVDGSREGWSPLPSSSSGSETAGAPPRGPSHTTGSNE